MRKGEAKEREKDSERKEAKVAAGEKKEEKTKEGKSSRNNIECTPPLVLVPLSFPTAARRAQLLAE